MQTLAYLKSRRLWVIPNLLVWGIVGEAEFYYLGYEMGEVHNRVMFGISSVGEVSQTIQYGNLIDSRGNSLPETIKDPKVIVVPRSKHGAFPVGGQSENSFKIARDPDAPGPVTVDLFIFETGH